MASMLTQYNVPREIVAVEPMYKEYAVYLGDYSVRGYTARQTVDERLAIVWHNMMRKCYHEPCPAFEKYGAKGAFVCKPWHRLETFLKEVKEIPHWEYKLADFDGFCLDSDYYGANCYSKDTCVWVTNSENAVYRDQASPVRATHLLTQKIKIFLSIAEAARSYGMSDGQLGQFISGEKSIQPYSKVAGFKFERIAMDGRLLRYKLIGKICGQ